jgi:hypothetical protein
MIAIPGPSQTFLKGQAQMVTTSCDRMTEVNHEKQQGYWLSL